MKKLLFFALAVFSVNLLIAQLPSEKIKNLEGETIDTKTLSNDGKPMIISFWATWCKPCKAELNAIAEEYEDWIDETGVKLIAVSIDDARSTGRVEPYVVTQGWEYEVLLDVNGDFKRAMNVNNVPHVFVVDGNGKIVWDHNVYVEGGEAEILEQVEKLAN